MGSPPEQGHVDAADFLCSFCVTLEYFFSSAKTSKKNPRTNNLRKNLRKKQRTKNLRQNRFAHSGFPEDGSQK